MDVFKKKLLKNYMNISQYVFQTNPEGHRYFQDLDILISKKDNFIRFIKIEYSISLIYNFIISLTCFYYLFTRFFIIFQWDAISTLWLTVSSFVKFIEIFPKSIILIQAFRIARNSNDNTIASRRLMYLTRSNIFVINAILGYINLFIYSKYFLFIRKPTLCEDAPNFYVIINFLINGFFLRILITFVNYYFHFKHGGFNEADLENTNFYSDYTKRVSSDIIELIESVHLDEKNINKYININDQNERDFCCICMLQFEIGENIKLLPCNKKHIFHNSCIDKWLSGNRNCPTCRKEINKLSLKKSCENFNFNRDGMDYENEEYSQ